MASEPDQHSSPASFYESPQAARHARPEEFLYLACMHEGTGVDEPDFLAVVDAQDGRVVHETPMPNVGDELHHFGWNRCSSACHGPDRSHLIVPGFRSSRIHVLNVADDPRRPRIEKVIEPRELVDKTGYTRPHTVHCMPGDNVVVSMLGDRDGGGAGGFAVLDARTFEVKGRWENGGALPPFNYDFWYQPRQNVLASSEFGEPNAYEKGFDIDDVAAGRYGSRLHFWNLAERRVEQTLELGEAGLLPFEVRWLHDPDADEGFVGAALSSTMWHFRRDNGSFTADPVIAVENVELDGWPLPGGVPSVITDLLVSMDDRFLYFTNWLHGDLRQYDISDPANPRLTGRLWLGGLLGKPNDAGRELHGGPQMIQLSLDGRRLYVTNSLYSTWDNQFYPELRSWLLRVNCSPDGGMEVDRDFFVDFHNRPAGPARAHEVRLQGGPPWRAADDPVVAGRAQALRHQLAVLDLGQPVLPPAALLVAASQLLTRRRDAGRPRLLRRLPQPHNRPRSRPRGAPPRRRLHHGDLPMSPLAHIAGMPVEETIASIAPALLLTFGGASAMLRGCLRRQQVGRNESPR